MFCAVGNFSSDFNVYFVYLKTFNVFRRENFLHYLVKFFSSVNTPKLGLELPSVIFSGNGGPFFSVLSYFSVRFSRYSVSADESSACETVIQIISSWIGWISILR